MPAFTSVKSSQIFLGSCQRASALPRAVQSCLHQFVIFLEKICSTDRCPCMELNGLFSVYGGFEISKNLCELVKLSRFVMLFAEPYTTSL